MRGKYRAYAPNCTINNIKMQKALIVGGTPPSHTLPPSLAPLARARSLCSLAHYFYRPPPPLKLNPGYATGAEELTTSIKKYLYKQDVIIEWR